MISVQIVSAERVDHSVLSVDIHHNETLLTLSVGSQVERIDLSEVRS